MKNNKQILIRVSSEEYQKALLLSQVEQKSVSSILRELINYRYNYLLKNNKVKKQEKVVENISLKEIDESTLNEFYKAFNVM